MNLKTSTILTILSLSSLALAAPFEHAHHHHHHKREADVVYVTNVVTVNEFADAESATATQETATASLLSNDEVDSGSESLSLSVTENAKEAVAPTTLQTLTVSSANTESATYSSAAEESASSATYSSSTEDSTSSAASASNTATAGSVEYYANQGKGITYSPYTDSGSCKSSSEIASDMATLSSFDIIRIYAPDCSVVSSMLSAISSNQQIFAGLYYMDSLESDIELLATQVKTSSRGWDAIYAVAVGNEWVNSGTYDAATVVSAVSNGRSLLEAQGFSGKVVTVDTVPAYQDNPSLCDASDFAAVNQHAFWNGAIAPENSGSFMSDTISELESLCSKDVLICETGWPTKGDTYGTEGVPGTSQQLACIKSIVETVPDKVILFTTFNDLWKSPGTYNVEQYFGLFD